MADTTQKRNDFVLVSSVAPAKIDPVLLQNVQSNKNVETSNAKGPIVQSVEMIEEAKKKQQRTMIIVAVVVIALSIGAVWFFTRKKKA